MLGACSGTEITLTDHEADVIRNDKAKAMVDDEIDDDEEEGEEVANESNESNEEESEDEEEEEEFEDAMDVDEFAASTSDSDSIEDLFGASSGKKKVPKRRKNQNLWPGLHGLDGIMAEALKFGYELQEDYQDDSRDEIKNTLKVS